MTRVGREEWVDAWRAVVRISPLTMGLLDLDSMEFVAMSPQAAELLGTTSANAVGLDYVELVEDRTKAVEILHLLRDGTLDSIESRRRLQRPDGTSVEVFSCGRAIRREGGGALALWVVLDLVGDDPAPTLTADVLASLPNRLMALEPVLVHPAFGTLDHSWRIAQITADNDELLGQRTADLIGTSLVDLTHPADVAALMLGFARATSGVPAAVRLRLNHRYRSWQSVSAVLTTLEERANAPFGFVIGADAVPDVAAEQRRVGELEDVVQRIGDEVQGAGIDRTLGSGADTTRIPALGELTPRQWEVISRLARGQRVPTIASEMFLSQSTVRNHLSAAFRTIGVHSQDGLLALLRRH